MVDQALVSSDIEPQTCARALLRRLALVAALLLVAVGASTRLSQPLNHDVSWLFVAAERMLQGGRLGVEIFELNAPGAVVLYVPAVWLSQWADLSAKTSVICYAGTTIGLLLLLARHFLTKLIGATASGRADVVMLFWAAIWTLLPGYDFAQREHFIVLLLMPYILLETCLVSGIAVAGPWRAMATLASAAAMMIKPHYALVLGGFLLIRLFNRGPKELLRSPEPWVILLSGLAYTTMVVTLCKEWIEVALKAHVLYRPYDGSWSSVLRVAEGIPGPTAFHALIALLMIPLAARVLEQRDAVVSRAVLSLYWALVICLAIYLIQRKGFTYHVLPLTLIVLSSMPMILSGLMDAKWSFVSPPVARLCTALLMTFIISMSLSGASKGPPMNLALARELEARATDGAVYAFTTGMRPLFPIVTEHRLRWASRFPCFWTLVGIYHQRFPSDRGIPKLSSGQLDRLESELVDQVVEDFRHFHPATVVVDVSPRKQWLHGPLDFIYFFSADPRFERIWAEYRQVGKVGWYEIYSRMNEEIID